jgi:cysteine-rich repeat protein
MSHGKQTVGLCLLIVMCTLPTDAQVDDRGLSFSYDGFLETVGGEPVNQPVDLRFTIHIEPEMETPVWLETHIGYPVNQGIVQIELGLINPIDPGIMADPNLFLGVSIDDGPEMTPRLKIGAVLRAQWARYAFHARDVTGEHIDPASVSVNGIQVIDAAGNWSGGSTQTGEQIRDLLLQVDGSGSGIDADRLDGLSSESLVRTDQASIINGSLTINAALTTDTLIVNQNIGIGTATPKNALDVNGAIRIGTTLTCDAEHVGTVRYANATLEVCDGAEWQLILTNTAHPHPHGCVLSPLIVDGVEVTHGRSLDCHDQPPIRVFVLECGNGVLDQGETCDDSNFTNDDGCNDHCRLECGDGVVGENEGCDDGNLLNDDACTATCTVASCGDGFVQTGVEMCDGGDNCLPDCTQPACGQTGTCPALDFVAIAGGVINMGYVAGTANELPVHAVTVPSFEILRGEITVAQYTVCVNAGVCTAPKSSDSSYNWNQTGREQYPVNGVSWRQAQQFATWVGAQLPTEAQWEFAATSGGLDQRYPWGDDVPTCTLSQNFTCAGSPTTPVCTHPTGHSAQGVCDLAGNAWEWVLDNYHGTYDGAPIDGSAWCNLGDCSDDGSPRVWKGGDYLSDVTRMRSSSRGYYGPESQHFWMGFRLAR